MSGGDSCRIEESTTVGVCRAKTLSNYILAESGKRGSAILLCRRPRKGLSSQSIESQRSKQNLVESQRLKAEARDAITPIEL